jgi:hypothetical protein
VSDLLECPFCGGDARIYPEGKEWISGCWSCDLHFVEDTEDRAVSRWNTRARPEPSEAVVEALKALLVAVTYAEPPKDYGTAGDPNLCFEARVPVQFVDDARAAIAAYEGERLK